MKAWLDKRQYKLGPLTYWDGFFFGLDTACAVSYFFRALHDPRYLLWGTIMAAAAVLMLWILRGSLRTYWLRAETKRMRAETAAIMQRVYGEWQ